MKTLEAFLLLGALLIFLSHLHYALPITSDAYENLRQMNYLQKGGSFPIEGSAIDSLPSLYPPLFALGMHSFKTLTNFSGFFVQDFFSYLYLLLLVFSFYLLLSRIYPKDHNKIYLGPFALFLLPIIVYRLITPIAEMLGLVLFLLSFHAAEKKDYRLLFLLLSIFPLAHSRSFVFTIVALALFSLQKKNYIEIGKSAILGLIIFALISPKPAISYDNPAIAFPSLFELLPILSIAIIALGLYGMFRGKRMFDPISLSILLAFAILYFVLPFPFRHVIFLLVPMAFLSAEALSIDRRILGLFAILLPLAVVQTVQFRSAPFDFQAIEAFKVTDSFDGKNVIASFKNNYALPYFGEKKVIVGAFAEGLVDGGYRSSELWGYFDHYSDSQREGVLQYYDITLGFFEKEKEDYLFEERIARAKLLESDGYAVLSFTRDA